MNTTRINFRVTTILPNSKKEIGSISGRIYSILNYLENIGLEFSLSKMYAIKKPIEYLIEGDNLNNVISDFCHKELVKQHKQDNIPIHVKIERLGRLLPYQNR